MDRVQSRIEVLRVWARSNDPNRAALIENAINECLKSEAIEREEAAKPPRRGLEHSEGLRALPAS